MEVLTSMQDLINSWGILEVICGALRTEKSWYYLINYIWKQGKWIATDPDISIDLMAYDMNGKRIRLSHLRCDEAVKILGVWMDPDNNSKKVVSVLKACTVEWEVKLNKATHQGEKLGQPGNQIYQLD